MSVEIAFPQPHGICLECQSDAPVLKHDPSGRLAVYCEHNRAGAVLTPATDGSRLWVIYTPVERDEFVDSVLRFAERFRAAAGRIRTALQ